jgi:hypothetical protein
LRNKAGEQWGKQESVAQRMAWEERDGKSYYYQKRREGERVVSQYIGTGYVATLAAQLDQIERERRAAERAQWHRQQAEHAALDSEIAEYTRLVQTITAAVLLASGCHRPKRQWRVKREQS